MRRLQNKVDSRSLTNQLKHRAHELGADLVKAGPVERWNDPPPFDVTKVHVYPHSGHLPTELMPSTRSFIVVAVRMLDGVVDTTTTACKTTAVQGNFAYVYLNRRLHDITFGLASWLEDRGYRSAPLGYNIGSRYDHKADEDEGIIGPAHGLFSMKRAAILAGLGRKARNGLVASPELGTRMRLGALITAAELEGDPLLEGDPCLPDCDVCATVCPTHAISRDGRVSHLRCFSDAGLHGIYFEELKAEFKKRYPSDLPGVDYLMNDFLAIDGNGHRLCKIACVAMCPRGEHAIPDVVRRAKRFDNVVPKVELHGFPVAHTF
jgi:epoxyqueuosine reductase